MELNSKLLFSDELTGFSSKLNGSNALGSYSTMQFVLRLRDDVRRALEQNKLDRENILATSTSIHENIHWWQHIGSNFGFLFSLTYPAFASKSIGHLKELIKLGVVSKSLIKFNEEYTEKHGITGIPELNIILNDFYDLEYAKRFTLDNGEIDKIQSDIRYYLNMGHCFHVFWSSTVHVLASTVDNNYTFLPNTDNWVQAFMDMESQKVEGFYFDSPITVSPLGIQAIYEGQASFNQFQYLTVALDKNLKYSDFENAGKLYGIYSEAFECYLQVTGLAKPTNLLDPVVGLFLLVCDMAINPNNGFPLDIYDYENFINKNDPGIRFTIFCKIIAKNPDGYVSKLKQYSKEEYIGLCNELSSAFGCVSPYDSIKRVLSWFSENSIESLLKEEEEHKYSVINQPIRVMFSKYLRFQEDKWKHPNVFCWFGFHASGNSNIDFSEVDKLYKKHHALYTDSYDGEIRPVIFENYSTENITDTFNLFYKHNILFDLIMQWVKEDGDFTYDYQWLSSKSKEELIPSIKELFNQVFGIYPDDVKAL